MDASANLFFYSLEKSEGLLLLLRRPNGEGLRDQFSPWQALGVLRGDQKPPYGLSRQAIESGLTAKGYQLLRKRKKTPATATAGRS